MNILGISGLYHDSAAAIINDKEILAAVQEERFTRIKNDKSWPKNSINYCLSNLKGSALDSCAYYEKPDLKFDRIIKSIIEFGIHEDLNIRENLKTFLSEKPLISKELKKLVPNKKERYFIEHHLSHAASAFYPSNLIESAILVVDSVGEHASTSILYGNDTKIKTVNQINYPHSLGLFYSAVTYFCGFKVNSGEYKLMGLAPFGDPIYYNKIKENIIECKPDGSFSLNLEYFTFHKSNEIIGKAFESIFNVTRRIPESKIEKVYADLAASVQKVLEEIIIQLAKSAMNICNSKNICLAGGVALNCVANGKLYHELKPQNIWVQPASGDAGGALGAALFVLHHIKNQPRFQTNNLDHQKSSFLGPSFINDQIMNELIKTDYKYILEPNRIKHNSIIAEHLSNGKIVGRFQDRMEYGPRALGNRSILGNPKLPNMQSKINNKIKFRESWRPFAPAVLSEKFSEYFIGKQNAYMQFISKSISNKNKVVTNDNFDLIEILSSSSKQFRIPCAFHVNGTSRVQTVSQNTNSDFYQLINLFYKLTDCPMLINTSFNIRGEPIVCDPKDAFDCFTKTEMDILSIQDYIVFKDKS